MPLQPLSATGGGLLISFGTIGGFNWPNDGVRLLSLLLLVVVEVVVGEADRLAIIFEPLGCILGLGPLPPAASGSPPALIAARAASIAAAC